MTIKNIVSKFFLFACVVLILQACEQPIDLPVQDYEGSIVIYSVLEADSVPKVFVTESEPYYTYTNNTELKYELLKNASITISDGAQTWELNQDSIVYQPIETGYWGPNNPDANSRALAFTNSNVTLQPSTNYTITVNHNNRTASAETYVLERPFNFTFEYVENIVTYYGYEYIEKRIEYSIVNTTPGLYYRIVTKDIEEIYNCDFSQYPPELLDSTLVDVYRFSYRQKSDIQDDLIEGDLYVNSSQCYNFSGCIYSYTQSPDSAEVQIALQVIDSTLIRYIDQLQFQEDVQYNPFLEPAPVDHNVDGGIGIVGATTNSPWQTIKFPCE